jgi:F0F1-type ATP synthase assembly protein I
MNKQDKQINRANQFFRRELEDSDIQKSVHYTFKDGFRLGFGFFVGFLLGTLILGLLASLVGAHPWHG